MTYTIGKGNGFTLSDNKTNTPSTDWKYGYIEGAYSSDIAKGDVVRFISGSNANPIARRGKAVFRRIELVDMSDDILFTSPDESLMVVTGFIGSQKDMTSPVDYHKANSGIDCVAVLLPATRNRFKAVIQNTSSVVVTENSIGYYFKCVSGATVDEATSSSGLTIDAGSRMSNITAGRQIKLVELVDYQAPLLPDSKIQGIFELVNSQ